MQKAPSTSSYTVTDSWEAEDCHSEESQSDISGESSDHNEDITDQYDAFHSGASISTSTSHS